VPRLNSAHIHGAGDTGDSSELICPILGLWRSKVPQNGRFPALERKNRRAKFDAANFILGGEIRKCTKNTQAVTDISTLCLLERVDSCSNHHQTQQPKVFKV